MKKVLVSMLGAVSMALAGCGGTSLDGGTASNTTTGNELSDGQIAGVVISGTGTSGEVANEAQADLNAEVAKVLASKVEEEINAELQDPAFQAELENATDESGTEKDVRVGLGTRGLSIFIEDEAIPFAGGSMLLNGDVGLKLRIRSGLRIDVVASGELIAELQNVQREGTIRDIPYVLELNGKNKMGIDGTFSVTVKLWSFKVSAMSAEIVSGIKESDVVAVGTIGERTVTGTVDMMDVQLKLSNGNIIKNPGDFKIACSGDIVTMINDNVVASCKLAETCLSCDDEE